MSCTALIVYNNWLIKLDINITTVINGVPLQIECKAEIEKEDKHIQSTISRLNVYINQIRTTPIELDEDDKVENIVHDILTEAMDENIRLHTPSLGIDFWTMAENANLDLNLQNAVKEFQNLPSEA